MKLLLIGGSSYLGAAILKRASTHQQFAATYFKHPISHPNVAAFRVDARHLDEVQRLVGQFKPDAIIHTPAVMSGEMLTSST
jgi:dTDP-4-dehydrorhamnose reductase